MSLEQPDTNQLAQVEAGQADAMLNQIEHAALADAQLVATETAVIEEEVRQVAGLEAEAARTAEPTSGPTMIEDIATSVSSKPAQPAGNTEGRVYGELLWEKSGVHAAANIVKTGYDIMQDTGTGIGRQGKAAQSIGAHQYRTIDDYAKEMRGIGTSSGKRSSFKVAGDEGSGLVERANISGTFTKNSSMRGANVQPDAINVQLVKSAVLAKTQNLEQNAALVNAQQQTLGNVQQARTSLGLGNNSPKLTQDLSSGPKFRPPSEEGSGDTTSSWA